MATATIQSEEKLFDTELRERRAQTGLQLNKILVGVVGGMLFSLIAAWFIVHQEHAQFLVAAGFLVAGGVGIGLYPYFHRQGQVQTGAYVMVTALLISVFATLEMLPEINVVAGLGYIAVICLSSLLIGTRQTVWMTILSAIALLANLVSGQAGFVRAWFIPLEAAPAYWLAFVFAVIALPSDALIIVSIMKGQEDQFRQARRAGLEVERRAATEREQRQRLQTTVQRYVEYMAQVARGNLATQLKLDGDGRGADDPLIVLGLQLNDTTASLQQMIAQIRDAANNLGSASAEILAATTQQASGASEQSAAISQTTTTVDEVKTIAEQASVRAQEVTGASQRTVEVSR